MALDKYHVTKKGNEWRMEKAGSNRAVVKGATKAETIDKMREYMSDKTGSVRIHKQDGTIQEERTYQRKDDPRASKG